MKATTTVRLCAALSAILPTVPPSAMAVVTNSWNGGVGWADFGTVANWSVGGKLADGGVAATSVPGEDDFISCDPTLSGGVYHLGFFDLGGQSWTVRGWAPSSTTWKMQQVHLTNGTLTVRFPNFMASGVGRKAGLAFTIESGARLVYPAVGETAITYPALADSGLYERWIVNAGGAVEIYGPIGLQGPKSFAKDSRSEVRPGGRLVFDPSTLVVVSSNEGGYSIDNYGVTELPHGVDWSGASWTGASGGCDESALTFRQLSGRMSIGGDFVMTAKSYVCPGRMAFVLGGGTLEVTGDVGFYTADSAKDAEKGFGEQVYAEMPDGAAAVVDVADGKSIDMTAFTYGTGTALTKAGAGTMTLDALPASLAVNAGAVALTRALAGDEGIALAEGSTVVLCAKGNSLDGVQGVANASWTLGDWFAAGDVVATGGDETLAAFVEKLTLPESLADCGVRVVDGAAVLYLAATVEIRVRDLTLYAGDAAADAGYVVVNARTGEVVPNAAITGTPAWSCGYSAGSGTGTYEISVGGLSSEDLTIERVVAGTVTVVPADERKVFYWKGGTAFADFGDVANWAMDAALSTPATRLPGRKDFVANVGSESEATAAYGTRFRLAKWDLLGGAQSFYAYAGNGVVDGFTAWKNWWIDITNGTLTVCNPTVNANQVAGGTSGGTWGHLYNVWDGATLLYPADSYENKALAGSGLIERWEIHAGGTVKALGGLMFVSTRTGLKGGALVEAGGTLHLDPQALSAGPENNSGIEIVNRGDMVMPNGLVWTATGYCQATTAASGRDELLVIQEAGRMLLGGDVMRTNNYYTTNTKLASRLELILRGGILEVTNSVRVATSANSYTTHIEKMGEEAGAAFRRQAFASLDAEADVTIDVKADSSIDMTEFTYGANARLTTKGSGAILFGPTLPARLAFGGGALSFAAPEATTEPTVVSFASGASGTFALRAWLDGDGIVRSDEIDLTDGIPDSVVIRPTAFGFTFRCGDAIRLGDYPAGLGLPAAARAAKRWSFCRMPGDEDGLYLRRGDGMRVIVR